MTALITFLQGLVKSGHSAHCCEKMCWLDMSCTGGHAQAVAALKEAVRREDHIAMHEARLESLGYSCLDEGCPHYHTPHSHPKERQT